MNKKFHLLAPVLVAVGYKYADLLPPNPFKAETGCQLKVPFQNLNRKLSRSLSDEFLERTFNMA